MNCKLAELKTMLTFVLDHGYNIPKDWRRRIASRQAQTDTGPVIRCSDCGGTVIWKKTTEGYEVIHGCGNGKQACAAIASAEARARLEGGKEIASAAWQVLGALFGINTPIPRIMNWFWAVATAAVPDAPLFPLSNEETNAVKAIVTGALADNAANRGSK